MCGQGRVLEGGATWMVTAGWLSLYVEKTWSFLVGIVVLRGMRVVMTPPAVSMPSDSGATSSSSRSCTCTAASQMPVSLTCHR